MRFGAPDSGVLGPSGLGRATGYCRGTILAPPWWRRPRWSARETGALHLAQGGVEVEIRATALQDGALGE